jgi:uncharacterized protein
VAFPDLTIPRAIAIIAAGGAAGFINSIVGSGTLISFPTLVGVGFDRVAANVGNNLGLTPGSLSAAYGFRRELQGQRRRLLFLSTASISGSLIGALLLLNLPPRAFRVVVPFLVLIGVVLVVSQPRIMTWVRARQTAAGKDMTVEHLTAPLWIGVFLTGIYGGYFGAAQGVILIGVMGALLADDLVRINAAKNVLSALVGIVASVVFLLQASVPWAAAGLVAIGSISGGLLGARVGRRIPPQVLRTVVATVGTVVALRLLWDLR